MAPPVVEQITSLYFKRTDLSSELPFVQENFYPSVLSTDSTVGSLVQVLCRTESNKSPTRPYTVTVRLYLVPSSLAKAVDKNLTAAQTILEGEPLFVGDTLAAVGITTQGAYILMRILPAY